MDIQPDNNSQPISDDQELAKVLAGITDDAAEPVAEVEETVTVAPPTPMPTAPPVVDDTTVDEPAAEPVVEAEQPAEPVVPDLPAPTLEPTSTGDAGLDAIKEQALGELRPLVDKLNVSPEEKFDTYLLLLRSTDDKDLIAPAHEAAKGIADEARKAQALLDIIKEIDFLNQAQ